MTVRNLRRRRSFLPTTPWLAVRGLVAVAVAGVVAAALVGRATGSLDPTGDVYVGVPVSAGLITSGSPVRYHGVNVGRIAAVESGTQTSRVRLAIDSDSLPLIPASVVARIVPRTFFGDIYLQLADRNPDQRGNTPLTAGSSISIDDSADALALYDVFKKIVDVFSTIKPEKMQTALTAVSQALRNRGSEIGSTIDNFSQVSETLTPTLIRFLDTTPQFRQVMESLNTAAPDIVSTLSAATNVSHRMVDASGQIAQTLDALAGLGSVLTPFLGDYHGQLITVVDAAGKIMATTAANPDGLVETLSGAQLFGAAGARTFATGKFSITAVATFAGPMPYTAADCPVYGTTFGAHCADADPFNPVPETPLQVPLPDSVNLKEPAPVAFLPEGQPSGPGNSPPPIVDGPGEAPPLAVLEGEVRGQSANAEGTAPNIATVVMLGPLVRGTEVRVS